MHWAVGTAFTKTSIGRADFLHPITFPAMLCPLACILMSLARFQKQAPNPSAFLLSILLTWLRPPTFSCISHHITALFRHIEAVHIFICNLPLWFRSYYTFHVLSAHYSFSVLGLASVPLVELFLSPALSLSLHSCVSQGPSTVLTVHSDSVAEKN